ncbi:hypothetical protein K491DRAFT_721470 [Lophiostoma macrostomum CBS 122681]|uniref:F-box domain-containing protein n=1 Tax=Lophiostoma macrostomum CBS 122681 TaxID=1314788 RepID=A0A6A6SPJ9_9PLEO|nr:hypothetical protein K491DRAFT_721470 [Lophiostoma macrostomum CBS 122681]
MSGAASLGLADLANELLDEIASYLDQGDVYAFVLICRKTRDSGYNVLYRSYTNLDPARPFSLFLRTISARPDLAGNIRSLQIRGWDTEGDCFDKHWKSAQRNLHRSYDARVRLAEETYNTKPRDMDLLGRYLEISKAFNLMTPALWNELLSSPIFYRGWSPSSAVESVDQYQLARSLWDDAEEGHLLLILSLVPSLRFLHVQGMRYYPKMLNWNYFCHRNTRLFQRLEILSATRDVSYGWCCPDETFDNLLLRCATNANSLSHINLEKVGTFLQTLYRSFRHEWHPSTSVRTLSFRDMSVPLEFLRKKTTHGVLEKFELVIYRYASICWHNDPIVTSEIIRCLLPSKASLVHLCLEIVPMYQDVTSPIIPGLAAYIANFDQLLSLHIDIWTLFILSGHDVKYARCTLDGPSNVDISQVLREQVPSSLEFLRLVGIHGDIFMILFSLVALMQDGVFTELKRIALEFGCTRRETSSDNERRIETGLRELGVDVMFSYSTDYVSGDFEHH